MLSATPRVTFTENGSQQTYFRVEPGKPVKMQTNGAMVLVVRGRAIADNLGKIPATEMKVTVVAAGVEPRAFRETVAEPGPLISLSSGEMAGGPKPLRVPIETPSADITLEVSAPLVVGFSRAPLPAAAATPAPTPTATPTPPPSPTPTPKLRGSATPKPTPLPAPSIEPLPDTTPLPTPAATPAAMPAPALELPPDILIPGSGPLIRKKVERLSIGIRGAGMAPGEGSGSSPYGSNLSDLYLGGELRFTMAAADRRFSVGAEAGSYQLRTITPVVILDSPGTSQSADVTVTTRVTPVLATFVYREKFSDRSALFAQLSGGAMLVSRTESVYFNKPLTFTDTRGGGIARVGYDMKAGPGRLVLEAGYLGTLKGPDPHHDSYLGGGLFGLQYRLTY